MRATFGTRALDAEPPASEESTAPKPGGSENPTHGPQNRSVGTFDEMRMLRAVYYMLYTINCILYTTSDIRYAMCSILYSILCTLSSMLYVLEYTVFWTELYSALLYSTPLYSTLLNSTLLHSTLLFYTSLYKCFCVVGPQPQPSISEQALSDGGIEDHWHDLRGESVRGPPWGFEG